MNRMRRIIYSIAVAVMIGGTFGLRSAPAGDDWQPISQEDLALKDNPASPGAHAMILYRESSVDAKQSVDREYIRIKIFTQEGTKQGDVEIPFTQGQDSIQDIRARTIRPDGSIVDFQGKPFEKTVVKVSGFKFLAKTFTLPDVQPGCIIEYRYRDQSDPNVYYDNEWKVNGYLFTRFARFSIKPDDTPGAPPLMYRQFGLPKDTSPQRHSDGSYWLDFHNLPGIEDEPFMPPESTLRGTVSFFYRSNDDPAQETVEQYWKRMGKNWSDYADRFVNKKGALESDLSKTVSPSDAPEVKLQKIYARVQKIRNLNYEESKSKKELKQENLKQNNNVEDVINHEYAYGRQVNLLLLGLARTAGFEASELWVAARSNNFFLPEMRDSRQLNAELVWVRAGSKEYYLDPASRFYPFGLLPWSEAGTRGVRTSKQGGEMVETPLPPSDGTSIMRHGKFAVEDDGTISGKLDVDFTGQRAAVRREDERSEDETGRKKALAEEIQGWLPAGATYEITSLANWDNIGQPIHVEGTLKVPGFATPAGRRLLVPVTFFVSAEAKAFQAPKRMNPVYFHYQSQEIDDLKLEAPAGYKMETLPPAQKAIPGALTYEISAISDGIGVEVKRQFNVDTIVLPVESYPALRRFCMRVKTSDDAQIVLQNSETAKSN